MDGVKSQMMEGDGKLFATRGLTLPSSLAELQGEHIPHDLGGATWGEGLNRSPTKTSENEQEAFPQEKQGDTYHKKRESKQRADIHYKDDAKLFSRIFCPPPLEESSMSDTLEPSDLPSKDKMGISIV